MSKVTSDIGIKKISQREGVILKGYLDSKGLLTVGVGHLVKKGEPYKLGVKITMDEALRLLKEDLAEAEAAVNDNVKTKLTQNEFDALVSFIINIGVGGFKKSQVLKHLNAANKTAAANAMMNWVTPPEITGRRRTEKTQFLTPYKAVDVPTPKPQTLESKPETIITDEVEATPPPVVESSTTVETAVTEEGATVEKTTNSNPTVEVKQQDASLWAKIVALFGTITAMGFNAASLIQTKLEEISPKHLLFMIITIALCAGGWYLWNKSKNRAHQENLKLIDVAADTNKNNVVLK